MTAAIPLGIRSLIVFGLLATTLHSGAQTSQGCAAAWRRESPPVYISEESAIIVWDQATNMQHFIRKAAFQAGTPKGQEATDFGFLVPTPTIPALAEVGKEAFSTIAQIMMPPRKETSKLNFTPAMCFPFLAIGCGMHGGRLDHKAANVQVLHQQQVAGYDATVLEASDGKSLNDWLGKNGYVSRPALADWLDYYVKAKWKITAFKIADKAPPKSAADELFRPVTTGAVRMSFSTDKPFFPYREPEDKDDKANERSTGRLMQVFFLGKGRVAGQLDDKDRTPWDASVRWSDQLTESSLARLAKELDLPPGQLGSGTWLTTFEDRSRQRPQQDLYFVPPSQQTPVLPSPIIVYTGTIYLPVDLILLGLVAVVFLLRVVIRRTVKR